MILNVQMYYRQIHKLRNWYFKTYQFLPSCMTVCLKLRESDTLLDLVLGATNYWVHEITQLHLVYDPINVHT